MSKLKTRKLGAWRQIFLFILILVSQSGTITQLHGQLLPVENIDVTKCLCCGVAQSVQMVRTQNQWGRIQCSAVLRRALQWEQCHPMAGVCMLSYQGVVLTEGTSGSMRSYHHYKKPRPDPSDNNISDC